MLMPALSRQRGVTLIELAVTMAMFAVLLAAVAPSIGTWVRNTQIRNTATSIQAGLMRARNEAVRRNQPVRFSLVSLTQTTAMDDSCAVSSSGVSWVVSLNDPAAKCATAVSDTTAPRILEKHAGGVGGNNVTVAARTSGGAAADTITFNGFGRVTGAAAIGRIDVDNVVPGGDYRELRLVVGAGGTIRMCEPDVTAADDPRRC